MKIRNMLYVSLTSAMLLGGASASARDFRAADNQPMDYPTVLAMKFMGSQIAAATNGKYDVKVYGNSHGFVKGYAASRNSLSCVLIGEQDGDMQRDYGYSSSRALSGLWTPQRIADEAVERISLHGL